MQHFVWLLVATIFLSCVLYASSASEDDRNVKASLNIYERFPDGSYRYRYLVPKVSSQNVYGHVKDVNGTKVYSVEGSYSYEKYTGVLGTSYMLKYIADENGFRVLSIVKDNIPSPIGQKSIASLLGG